MSRTRFQRRVRDELHTARPPRAAEAERRAWEVVRAAHAERSPVRRPHRGRRVAVVAVAAALAAVVALTPAGARVGDWIGDVVDPAPDATPSTLGSLPAKGRLLVVSPGGPWIVRDDGARRRLGDFRDATWSPGGLFVAATRGRELVALEPDGDEVWARPAPGRVDQPRWSPDGFRIAYRSGRDLWIAIGDNSGARLLARGVAAAPPAWQPGRPSPGQVLAFASGRRIRIVEVDGPRIVGATPPAPVPRELWWTADGRRLLAVSTRQIRVHDERGRLLHTHPLPPRLRATGSALDTAGGRLAVAAEHADRRASELLLYRLTAPPGRPGGGAAADRPSPGVPAHQPSPGAPADRSPADAPTDRSPPDPPADRSPPDAPADRSPRGASPRVLARGASADRLFAGPGTIEGLTWSMDGRVLVLGLPESGQWLLLRPRARGRLQEVSGIRRKFAGGSRAATRATAPFPRPAGWCYAEPPDPSAVEVPPCSTGAAPAG